MPVAIIRPVQRSDWTQWRPLWEAYNSFYGRVAPDEITQTTWKRFFDSYEPVHALIAELDGRLVGIAHYIFHRNTSAINPVCYLQDLFTLAEMRGRGVGRQLIEAVYAAAERAGCPRVYWQTQETNAQATALYDKVADRSGFVVYRKQLPSAVET